MRMVTRMTRTLVACVLRPRVSLPILLGVVLLLVLLALGNVHDVLILLGRFQPRFLLAFAAVMMAYEVIRCLQWRFLLTALGIRVPVRTQVVTYVTGEVMKSMPLGNYFPDYVLQRSQQTEFGRASSVTLAINLMEVAITLVGLVALGVHGWEWLRPLIVFGLLGLALLVWLLTRWLARANARTATFRQRSILPEWLLTHSSVRRAVAELRQFRAGSVQLLRPRVLLPAAGFSASYLTLGGVGLALLAWGLGLQQVTLGQAVTVYFFSLAFATIIPVPMDLGSTELGGVGVFLALGVGVGKSAAVGVMVLDRTLALGSSLALALVVGLVLQAEVRAEVRAFARARVQAPAAAAEPRRLRQPRRTLLRRQLGAAVQRLAPTTGMPGSGVLGAGVSGLEPAYPVASLATCMVRTLNEEALPAERNATDRSPCRGWIPGSVLDDARACGVSASLVACECGCDGHRGPLAA